MAGFFTGVSGSGRNLYKVGQQYHGRDNRGRETTFTAQADGTFKQDDTGQVRVGSSQNREARFYRTARSGDGVVRAKHPLNAGSGSGVPAVKPGGAGAGPGSSSVTTGGPGSGGAGAGSQLVVGGPLKITTKDEGTGILTGGDVIRSNPWWSDAAEWEERYAEPGEWLGGAIVMGADAVFNIARGIDAATGTRIVTDRPERVPDIQYGDGFVTFSRFANELGAAFARQDARWSQQLNRHFNTGRVVPQGGF